MIKRLMLGVVLATTAVSFAPAGAASCVAAGPYYHASATFRDEDGRRITIYGESLGTFAGGVVGACSDGTGGAELTARPLMTISVDGAEVCRRTDPSSRLTSDPVAHAGGGVHNPLESGTCGADVAWDALVATPTVWLGQTVTIDSTGAQVTPLCKSTGFSGKYWLNGDPAVDVPSDPSLPVPIIGRAYFCESGVKLWTDMNGV
ncbi:MAG TPA: hypothetical protein VGB83_04115 [Actinomycetota bacterium]